MTGAEAERPLRPAEQRFVQAFLATGERRAAATEARISTRTAGRFLADPAVQAAISGAAEAALREAAQILAAGAGAAARTMRQLVEGQIVPDGVRLAACSRLLDAATTLIEFTSFAARLVAVEEAVGLRGSRSPGGLQ